MVVGGMPGRTPEDELTFDIGYALKKAGVRQPIEACRLIAARVVEHLKLCQWKFTPHEPGEAHGSALPPKVDE